MLAILSAFSAAVAVIEPRPNAAATASAVIDAPANLAFVSFMTPFPCGSGLYRLFNEGCRDQRLLSPLYRKRGRFLFRIRSQALAARQPCVNAISEHQTVGNWIPTAQKEKQKVA